jgi:hypothetical protein
VEYQIFVVGTIIKWMTYSPVKAHVRPDGRSVENIIGKEKRMSGLCRGPLSGAARGWVIGEAHGVPRTRLRVCAACEARSLRATQVRAN